MDTDVKNSVGKVEHLMQELKDFSQKKWQEVDEKGAATGETLEQINNRLADLDKKYSVVEKRALRSEVESAKTQGLELEMKDINKQFASKGMATIDSLDEYQEVKEAAEKYLRKGSHKLSPNEIKSFNSVIDPDGGYLIMPTYSNRIIDRVFEARQVIGNVNVETPATGIFKDFIDFEDYNDGTYQNQLATAPTDSGNQDMNLITITAGDQYYPKDFHRSYLEDVGNDFSTKILAKLQAGMARKDATGVITGLGTDEDPIRGINTYDSGTSWNQVQQVTSETNDVFGWDDVLENLPSALFEDFHANAKFWMRRATFFSLLTAKDSQNRYQIGDLIQLISSEKLQTVLNGYPVLWDAGMPAVADGALAVGFGDLEAGYSLVRRKGFAVHRNESDPTKITLTGHSRVGGGLTNGQAIKLLAIQ